MDATTPIIKPENTKESDREIPNRLFKKNPAISQKNKRPRIVNMLTKQPDTDPPMISSK
jgi:hypothetical protein